MAIGDGLVWNEALPDNDTTANEIDDYNRDLRVGVRSRMAREHVWSSSQTVTNEGGHHNFVTLQVQTAAPTMAGTTGAAVWVKSSDKGIYITDSGATDYLVVASAKGVAVIPAGTGTQGDLVIGSSASGYTVTRLAGSADGRVLHTHSSTAAPSWLPIDLAGTSTVLTGVLVSTYGGLGSNLKFDSGITSVANDTETTIAFNFTFSAAPTITFGEETTDAWGGGQQGGIWIMSKATTNFHVRHNEGRTLNIHWIALGVPA